MSVRIEIDKASQRHIDKQLEILKIQGGKSAYWSLMKVAFKIKAEAQLRLTGRGHIVTSRLKNSIFVKARTISNVLKSPKNQLTYSDNKGGTYNSDLGSVALGANEFAIGSNVSYAAAIELGARPHVIEVKNKKVLSNGSQFFGKKVNHPGFAGDSYLYWAMKNVNIMESLAKDMRNDIKFGKYLKITNTHSEQTLTNAD